MVSVSSEAQPRYKQRQVFAVRHFPRGCGPKEVKYCVIPVGESSSTVVFENGEITESESKLVSSSENVKLEVRRSVRGCSELSEFGNERCYSKLYGAPKRRKVFPVRQFPPGCGPNSDIIGKNLAGKKVDEVSKHLAGESTIRVADAEIVEEKAKKNDCIKVILKIDQGIRSETGFGPQVSSIKHKILEGEKKHVDLEQRELAGCSASVQSENKLHPLKNMALAKQPVMIDKSARVAHSENQSNHEKSMVKLVTVADRSVRAENRNYSDTTKGEVKVSGKSILVRSNTDKNFYGSGIESNIGHVHIKSSLKLGSNSILDRSLSDKTLGGCRGDQAHKNIQRKDSVGSSSHGVLKSKFGSKLLDRDGKPLVGKDLVKESEIAQRANDSLKRKFSAEIDYKEHISVEGDDSLETYGERMIIQALLDAEHCPSRNSSKFGAVGSSGSIFPKRKMKEKDLVERNSASKVLPSFQQKNHGLIEDIDPGEGGSEKKFSTFRKPIESILTITPSVPFKSRQESVAKEEVLARHRVKRVLRIFQLICRKLLQVEESSSKKLGKIKRIDLQASKLLKANGEWVSNGEPILGHVLGVEVGDEFHYRVELSMVGLHRLFQGGIDSMKQNKMLVAISIVASGGYDDDVDCSDVLIYSGSGGTCAGDKQPEDQKLERGNLALKNNIEAQTPVRVILGFKEKGDPFDAKGKLVSTFTYAGLYHVESYWKERGSHGFNVFKFQLKRKPGQPELAFKEINRSKMLSTREGICVKDITQGKEKIPISAVNTIDSDLPNPFKYITKNIYPLGFVRTPPKGCGCIHGCLDSKNCACAVKNGGEIPYNFSGAIVLAKPLIYECGPLCKCPPSCHNRVVQHGIRMPLEVFKTKGRGWGVRSLKSISSGSFICAYLGELLRDSDAEQRTNDEYLFDIGQNYDYQSFWEDFPNLMLELQSSSVCDTVENVGFTIDAAEYGNIGRFINHSCSPNLYAQNVLYDHDDKRIPHIMFFAMDNIPPLQELTYHYNYGIDQVRDSEGNVKQKACHCGSPECRGRLY